MTGPGAIAKRVLCAIGFYRWRLRADPFPGVVVLCYHGVLDDTPPATPLPGGALHVRASTLQAHCQVLTRHCTPISGARFLRIANGTEAAPARPVLVTFDDGYAGVLAHGLPVLARYGVPAVVFACTGPIERGEHFWYDALEARHGTGAVAAAKVAPYAAWRALVEQSATPAPTGHPLAPLTPDQLRRLGQHPLIEVGAHTVNHPVLAHAPADVQEAEIAGAHATLARWLGAPPRLFAYPNGRPDVDYTPGTVARVAAHFADAFAVGESFTVPDRRRYEQRRFLMLDSVSGPELVHRLAISWPRPDR